MMVRGNVTLRDYTEEGLRDPAVLAMAERVCYRADPGETLPIGGQSALSRPAVEIRTREGRIFSCTPDGVPGDPAHPVGWDLLEAKFRDCVSFAHRPLVQGGADRMIELVQNLDCLDDVTEITRLFG